MERKWLEKIKNSSNEDLLAIIRRGGILAIEAAKEVISRLERGEILNPKIYQRAILKIRPKGPSQEKELEEIKEKITRGLLDDRLEEKDLLIILDEVKSQELRDEASEKFLSQKGKIRNYTLTQIIQKTSGLKNIAAEILLKQDPTTDELMVIEEECEGPIQLRAFKIHKRKGISKEDGIFGVWNIPELSELYWREIKGKNLSLDDLFEICRYADSEKIVREAATKMWRKRDSLDKQQLLWLYKNPQMVKKKNPKKIKGEVRKRLSEFDLTIEELIMVAEDSLSPAAKK